NMNSFLRRRFSKILVTVFATVLTFMHAGAQSVGDYFCVSSGNWDDVSIWLRYNGTGWVVPAAPPTYTDGEIHIDTAFTVSVNTNKILDQLYVGSTASLFVNGGLFVVNNGPGSDFTVDGSLSWDTSATLNMTTGSVMDGGVNMFYRGTTLINNGSLNMSSFAMNSPVTQTINGNGSIATFLPFTFTPGGIVVTGTQTITSQLSFNYGIIHTSGAGKISIANGANLINADATHYIDGTLEYYFGFSLGLNMPIGTPSKYLPVQLAALIGTPGNVSLRTDGGDHPQAVFSGVDPDKSINRTWTIDNSSATLTGFYMTLTWDPSDVDPGTNYNNLVARMYTGSSWIPLNVTGSSPTSIDVNYSGSDVGVIEIGEAGTIPNTGDYRSAAFGGWNDFTRWETFNGTAWVPAVVAPNGTNSGVITIRQGFNITNNSQPIQADQVVIESGASLFISEGTLHLLDGPGDDLVCNGSISINTGSINLDSTLIVTNT
ncbi:MAG TPA: hypothetical protein PKK99_13220, partial [Bacteroidia bacterium]|nr:hypothetical protein [Bacteroidia bacterium]